WIEVFAEFGDGLKDIEGFERLWLLFWCNRASTCRLVVEPYLDNSPHGIFATRSPSRPNPIGLSCVRLVGRDGLRLDIADVDLLDGTPLLDIKPFVPQFDNFEVGKTGWYGAHLPESKQAVKRFTR
ncbi:MAG: tRNA (N6-threonylcarbamoyladenosine(37)-N6)-methyltransferase TrmO, partial [Chloroflexi bacterium]|nr:tRNA (N6-threonylcarbamoyladenosine(37)-N6)-methyltransferase TrmO [Chloroflexota bacterium]